MEVKKRGRKANSVAVAINNTTDSELQNDSSVSNNINNLNSDNNSNSNNSVDINNNDTDVSEKPKKRTRRTKKSMIEQAQAKAEAEAQAENKSCDNKANIENEKVNNPEQESNKETKSTKPTVAKKRGRKPKGGKIIECPDVSNDTKVELPNVIVHFKCKLKDVEKILNDNSSDNDKTIDTEEDSNYGNYSEYTSNNKNMISNSNSIVLPSDNINSSFLDNTNKSINAISNAKTNAISNAKKSANNIENEVISSSFHSGKSNDLHYTFVNKEDIDSNTDTNTDNNINDITGNQNINMQQHSMVNNIQPITQVNTVNNDTMAKIHQMEVQFHNNNINGKRCSCFWCTCPFDTPAFYIPKSMDMNNVRPYGCFCSLNCALAYLQNEDIDISSKFERRQLLFNLYSNVVKDKTYIKPAPDPRYTLDKFYGNLSIQEWRSLLTSDRMLLIVDKPLTPELPELHTETTDRFMTMGSINTVDPAHYGKFKIRKVAPKQSKTDIVAEKFGVVTKQ